MPTPISSRRQRGFTLLEVMIAITIMAVAFGAILTSQSSSIVLAGKTKDLNLASWLARNLMVESEHLMEHKPFSELKKEEEKSFEAPYERFSWKREVREIKFPELPNVSGGKDSDAGSEAVRLMLQTIAKFFNNSLRELVVTVTWKIGTGEQHLVVTTYLIDLNAEFSVTP